MPPDAQTRQRRADCLWADLLGRQPFGIRDFSRQGQRPQAGGFAKIARALVQQGAQALGLFLLKSPLNVVRNGRARLETGQSRLIEGPDGIAHGLVTATQLLADAASRRATRIRQQYLAAPHHKGIGRTYTCFQRSAFVRC